MYDRGAPTRAVTRRIPAVTAHAEDVLGGGGGHRHAEDRAGAGADGIGVEEIGPWRRGDEGIGTGTVRRS